MPLTESEEEEGKGMRVRSEKVGRLKGGGKRDGSIEQSIEGTSAGQGRGMSGEGRWGNPLLHIQYP